MFSIWMGPKLPGDIYISLVTNLITFYNLGYWEHIDIKYKVPQDGALGHPLCDFCLLHKKLSLSMVSNEVPQ